MVSMASSGGNAGKKAADDLGRIAAKMTPQQIAEAQALARECQASNFKQCD
jgi:hypothetical protein